MKCVSKLGPSPVVFMASALVNGALLIVAVTLDMLDQNVTKVQLVLERNEAWESLGIGSRYTMVQNLFNLIAVGWSQ